MTIRTILVFLDSEASVDRLMALAVPLADAHGAHLIGLAVLPSFQDMPPMPDAGATVLIDEMRKAYEAEAKRINVLFENATARQSFVAEWRLADPGFGERIKAVVDISTCADLIIASEDNPGWRKEGYPDRAGLVALQTSRPLLLVPFRVAEARVPKTIMIAWNDSRECARATFDALPLLLKADSAVLVRVTEAAGRTSAMQDRQTFDSDLAAALDRHGVKCELADVVLTGRSIADTLFAAAEQRKADLIVMGAYGRSRLSEFLFGGVTRQALQGMKVPVLLSH